MNQRFSYFTRRRAQINILIASVGSQVLIASYIIIVLLLSFRFILQLFGANPSVDVINWIYSISRLLMLPFSEILSINSGGTRSVFDVAALIVMAVYTLFIHIMKQILEILVSRRKKTLPDVS